MPSAVIRSFSYDPQSQALTIIFQSGRRYLYQGVPETLAAEMKRAFSKGEFFNDHVRGRFPFERLLDE